MPLSWNIGNSVMFLQKKFCKGVHISSVVERETPTHKVLGLIPVWGKPSLTVMLYISQSMIIR